jgi:hypothetical protein
MGHHSKSRNKREATSRTKGAVRGVLPGDEDRVFLEGDEKTNLLKEEESCRDENESAPVFFIVALSCEDGAVSLSLLLRVLLLWRCGGMSV